MISTYIRINIVYTCVCVCVCVCIKIYNILWKNPNEHFGQLNTYCVYA